MKTLDRYLLRETLPLFGGGLLVIVLLFLGGAVYEVLAPLVAKGADPYTLLRYLLFRTPEALARGAPVAYLFALLVLLSRLGEDAELKALLALGVRRERLLLPFLLLGTAIALAAFLAERGSFRGGVLHVEEGTRITYEGSRPRTLARFQRGELVLKDLTFDPWQNPANRMTLAELRKEVQRLRQMGVRAGLEATTYYRRFAEPLAAPVFALFAVGLAFYLLGGSRSLGLVGVAVLTFFYYATWSVGRIMGEQNALDPFLAAFGPNLLYGALGLFLFLGGRR